MEFGLKCQRRVGVPYGGTLQFVLTLFSSCPYLCMLYLIIAPQARQEGLVIFWVNGGGFGTLELNRVKKPEVPPRFLFVTKT